MLRNSTIKRTTPLKRSTKRIPRTKLTPLSTLMRRADKLAAQLCYTRGRCEACGGTEVLQWAHMISRTYKGIRWDMENCFLLCRSCHFKFHNRPSTWIAWLMENWPIRYLAMERRTREIYKPNRWEVQRIIDELTLKLAEQSAKV